MHAFVTSLVFLLGSAFAVGCASPAVSPVGPSEGGGTATLTAGTWTLVSIQPAGQTERIVPDGASYTLTLADGRVSTNADCNVCGGSLVVGGQMLTIGPRLACTRAACPTMAFENSYVAMLEGDSAVRIDGNTFTLTSPRGVLRFRR